MGSLHRGASEETSRHRARVVPITHVDNQWQSILIFDVLDVERASGEGADPFGKGDRLGASISARDLSELRTRVPAEVTIVPSFTEGGFYFELKVE